jgi:hypothetical protein
VVVASVAILGSEIHLTFLSGVLFKHMDGEMANPFSPTYQSLNSLLRVLFVRHETLNPAPLLDWADGFVVVRAASMILLTVPTMLSLASSNTGTRGLVVKTALVFTYGLLLSPASASYHFVLLSIPAVLLVPYLGEAKNKAMLVLSALCYGGIGLIPVGLLERLDLEGILAPLAYPRLWLLVALFLLTLRLGGIRQMLQNTESVQ